MTEISFDGRVAIVTGGGRGLGRGYALELARRGARIVVNDISAEPSTEQDSNHPADTVVAEIEAAGCIAVPSHESVSTPDGGEAIVRRALEAFGRVDVLINNAGILRDVSFAKMTPEDFDAVLDVHLRGAFYVTRPAFAQMRDQRYGRIVFTTSAAGLFGNHGQANYAAAKLGVVGLANVVAIEGARYGILANVIAPGARTRMTEALGDGVKALRVECVVPMVVYLASERCELSHHIFSAAGGRFARAFMGVTRGWTAGRSAVPSAEQIAQRIDGISAADGHIIPNSVADEAALLADMLGD